MNKIFPHNKTKYYRAEHDTDNHYTTISNRLIKHNKLTFTEKGLMVYILSNSDDFIINKSAIIKQSGLGRKAIDKAFKNLNDLGYIEHIYKNNVHTWIINEDPEYCPKSNSTKVTAQKCSDISNSTEVISPLEQVIITKEINTKERNTNEEINKVENNNEMDLLGLDISLKSEPQNNEDDFSFKNNQVKNDLEFILSNSEHFKLIYHNNQDWKELNISNFSNEYIAFRVVDLESSKHSIKDKNGADIDNYNFPEDVDYKKLVFFKYMIKYSSNLPNSKLWDLFKKECESNYKSELLKELDLNNH